MTDLFEKLNEAKKKQAGTEQEFLALDFFEEARPSRKNKKSRDETKLVSVTENTDIKLEREEPKAEETPAGHPQKEAPAFKVVLPKDAEVVLKKDIEAVKPALNEMPAEEPVKRIKLVMPGASSGMDKKEVPKVEEVQPFKVVLPKAAETVMENVTEAEEKPDIVQDKPEETVGEMKIIPETANFDKIELVDKLKQTEQSSETAVEKIAENKDITVPETKVIEEPEKKADYIKDLKKNETVNVSGTAAHSNISKKTVNEAGKKNMSQIKPVRSMGSLTGKDSSVGQTLHEARESKGLSHTEVEQKTKIKAEFIRLLENDDFSRLPPLVYVVAYIKTLCGLYGIPQEDAMLLISSIKKGKEAPLITEDVARNLEPEKPLSPELKAKNKKILWISVIVVVVVLAWVIGIMMLIKGKKAGKTPDLKPASITAKDTPPAVQPKPAAVAPPAKTTTQPAVKPAVTPAPTVQPKPAAVTPPAAVPAVKPVETKDPKAKDPKGKDIKKKEPAVTAKPVEEKPVVKFSGAELEKFIPPQTLAMSELPIDGKVSKK